MKVKELIKRLSEFNPEMEVAVLDGSNGGGYPREINYGPIEYRGKPDFKGDTNADYEDLETSEGQSIVQMGFGFY